MAKIDKMVVEVDSEMLKLLLSKISELEARVKEVEDKPTIVNHYIVADLGNQ